ncbi:hypothetical protein BD779DRAFT_1495734, partial [Infundibulicybe gibba]
MSSTTSFMPTTSSEPYDDGTLSASAALAWKFYAFGMLAIFVTGILGTVIYLGCFKLRSLLGLVVISRFVKAHILSIPVADFSLKANESTSSTSASSRSIATNSRPVRPHHHPLPPSSPYLQRHILLHGVRGLHANPGGPILDHITQCPHLPAFRKRLCPTANNEPQSYDSLM